LRTIQVVLALLLAATACGKLLDLPGFVAVLDTYAALPETWLSPVALAVIAVEVVLAALFFLRVRPRATALACALLHVAYAAWAAAALARGLRLANCGCFGVFLPRPLTWLTVGEDLIATAVSLVLWRLLRAPAAAAGQPAPARLDHL